MLSSHAAACVCVCVLTVIQLYVVPSASSLTPAPPFVPTRYIVAFARATVRAREVVTVPLRIEDLVDAFTMTADAAGTRALVAGSYTLAVSRGVAGDELTVAVIVQP